MVWLVYHSDDQVAVMFVEADTYDEAEKAVRAEIRTILAAQYDEERKEDDEREPHVEHPVHTREELDEEAWDLVTNQYEFIEIPPGFWDNRLQVVNGEVSRHRGL